MLHKIGWSIAIIIACATVIILNIGAMNLAERLIVSERETICQEATAKQVKLDSCGVKE